MRPIRRTVSVTLSPPIRVFAFAGAVVAVGLVAVLFLLGRGGEDAATGEPLVAPTPATKPATKPAAKPATRPKASKATPVTPRKPTRPRAAAPPPSGFPPPVNRSLRHNRVVVVVAYTPGATVDAVVRAEARAGARAARAGFVPMSALSGRLMTPLVAKTGVLPSPAVVVVRRPGVVTAKLGVSDRETIAQAVAQARR
jgi:pyruvate/2-oxoglutarate dehydrogenase complex dihydrolipoamide acyltransferase (E2) component